MPRPDPAQESAARIHAAEDRVASFPRWLIYVAGLAILALTAWMLVMRQGGLLPPEVRAACEKVLREQSVKSLLDPEVSARAGGPNAPSGFGLIGPVRTTVRSREPELRWRPLPGATGYKVLVERVSDGAKVESSELPRDQHIWRPPALLVGAVHRWEVQALRDGQVVEKAPSAVPSGAVFKVLDPVVVAALEEVERTHPQDSFLLGVARARLGLRSEARLAFDAMKGDPARSELATKLSRELE